MWCCSPEPLINTFDGCQPRVSTPQNRLTKPSSKESFPLSQPIGCGRLGHLTNAKFSWGWWNTTYVRLQTSSPNVAWTIWSAAPPQCDQHEETINHLLVSCVFARQVWAGLLGVVGLHELVPQTVEDSFEAWWHLSNQRVQGQPR
jgi:hypothetical protein